MFTSGSPDLFGYSHYVSPRFVHGTYKANKSGVVLVGFLDSLKVKQAERKAAAAERKRQTEHDAAIAEWQSEQVILQQVLDSAVAIQSGTDLVSSPVLTKSDEVVIWVGGAGLREAQRGPTTFTAGSQGVSIPLGSTGIRYRVGATKGHAVQGQMQNVIIDTGLVTLTSERIVFAGEKATREWDLSKLVQASCDEPEQIFTFHVSNREKPSGLVIPSEGSSFNRALAISLAVEREGIDEVVKECNESIEIHRREEIAALALVAPVALKSTQTNSAAGLKGVPTSNQNTALVMSIIGFCGVTAVIGLILGIVSRKQAIRADAPTGKSTAAIVISSIWIALIGVGMISSAVGGGKTNTTNPIPSASPSASVTSKGVSDLVRAELKSLGFKCTGQRGAVANDQCRKGSYKDKKYGSSPLEMVNVTFNDSTAGQTIDGYVYPSTFKKLKPLGVSSNGSAGKGTIWVHDTATNIWRPDERSVHISG